MAHDNNIRNPQKHGFHPRFKRCILGKATRGIKLTPPPASPPHPVFLALKLNFKLILTLNLNVNLSLKIELEIDFEFEFELKFKFEFEIEFKIQINFQVAFKLL